MASTRPSSRACATACSRSFSALARSFSITCRVCLFCSLKTRRSTSSTTTIARPSQLQNLSLKSVLTVQYFACMPRKQKRIETASAAPKSSTHSTDLTALRLRTRRCAARNSRLSRKNAGNCANNISLRSIGLPHSAHLPRFKYSPIFPPMTLPPSTCKLPRR